MEKNQIYDFYKSSDTTSTPYAKLRHQFDINSTPIRHHTQILRHQFDTNSTPIRQCTVYQMGRTIYQIGVRSINSAYASSNRRTQRQRTITEAYAWSKCIDADQNISTSDQNVSIKISKLFWNVYKILFRSIWPKKKSVLERCDVGVRTRGEDEGKPYQREQNKRM